MKKIIVLVFILFSFTNFTYGDYIEEKVIIQEKVISEEQKIRNKADKEYSKNWKNFKESNIRLDEGINNLYYNKFFNENEGNIELKEIKDDFNLMNESYTKLFPYSGEFKFKRFFERVNTDEIIDKLGYEKVKLEYIKRDPFLIKYKCDFSNLELLNEDELFVGIKIIKVDRKDLQSPYEKASFKQDGLANVYFKKPVDVILKKLNNVEDCNKYSEIEIKDYFPDYKDGDTIIFFHSYYIKNNKRYVKVDNNKYNALYTINSKDSIMRFYNNDYYYNERIDYYNNTIEKFNEKLSGKLKIIKEENGEKKYNKSADKLLKQIYTYRRKTYLDFVENLEVYNNDSYKESYKDYIKYRKKEDKLMFLYELVKYYKYYN